MTLEQIGDMFGVTRERIRQIEAKAIRRIKWFASRKKYWSFSENRNGITSNIEPAQQEEKPDTKKLASKKKKSSKKKKTSKKAFPGIPYASHSIYWKKRS